MAMLFVIKADHDGSRVYLRCERTVAAWTSDPYEATEFRASQAVRVMSEIKKAWERNPDQSMSHLRMALSN